MSTFTDGSGKTILNFEFPKEKNLNFTDVNNIKNASFEQKRLVLLVSFREFLNGKLMLEELSEIANYLKMLFEMSTRTAEQEEYERVIYEAADLSYYLRIVEEPVNSMFAGFLYTLMDYFNKNKHLLDSLSSEYSEVSSFEK